MSSTIDAKRRGRSSGKENTSGKDIFNNEALDEEIMMQGSIAKELKGSIFTPKIVDGPRLRRSTAQPVNPPPPKPVINNAAKSKKTDSKPAKSKDVVSENKQTEKKYVKPAKEAPKKETKVKSPNSRPSKPVEPLMDSIDDDEDEDDDMEFGGHKRAAVLPSVIAMELEAVNAVKEVKTRTIREPSKKPAESPKAKSSPVKVVPVVHELPKPAPVPIPQPTVTTASDIPVLVDYKAAYETMREKFERLNLLRTTEAEKLLNDYKKTFTAQKQSADQLIDGLKTENERLKAQIQQLTGNSRRDSNVSTVSAASSTGSTADQLQNLSRQVDLYREMSGLEMEVIGDFAWKCVLSGRLGALHFNLRFDDDTDSFEYVPQVPANSPLVSVLPAYLLEDISFGPEQLQLFFWRAMNFLMSTSD